MRRKIAFFILVLMHVCLLGQQQSGLPSAHTKEEVRALFPAGTKNLWINYLSGTLGGSHIVDMILGTDGHTCKGLYTLRNGNTTFFVEGEDNASELRLIEYNKDYRATGFMSGKYDGLSFTGIWENTSRNHSYPVTLGLVNSFEEYIPQKCRQDQWIRIYRSTVGNQDISVKLSRENASVAYRFYDNGKKYSDLALLKGSRNEIIPIEAPGSVLDKKWLLIDTTDFSKAEVIRPLSDGYEVISELKETSSLVYECYAYADYSGMLECKIPRSENKKFNLWLDKLLKTWLDNALKKIKSTETADIGTADRWVISAQGWVETDLFTGGLASGNIYLQSSWNKKTEKIPFIFDLDNGREIALQELFINEFRAVTWFEPVVRDMKKARDWKPETRKWIDSQEFNLVSLTEEGISFRTAFSNVFGEKEILIPYQTVEAYLKRKDLLKPKDRK